MTLRVKIASEAREFEALCRINYRTFVEEIPQHVPNDDLSLVDRYHEENTYFLCLDSEELVGMVALRDRRPFSLDGKLEKLESHLPPFRRPCEIRLLTILPERRHGLVFGRLMQALVQRCLEADYDIALISGRLEKIEMYRKVGFRPFGPLVGKTGAWFQPMYIDRGTLNRSLSFIAPGAQPGVPAAAMADPDNAAIEPLNFLPGPVAIAPAVRAALAGPALSHRSEAYRALLEQTKDMLRRITRAPRVEILLGSGSLANDVVAAQFAGSGEGLILVNGEFGERLVRSARGVRARHHVHRVDWGQPFDLDAVGARLDAGPEIRWIWTVHCETSTGMINDAPALADLCARRGLLLGLDCISSLGVVETDLSRVHLATGVSGKGFGGYTGLSMVFHREAPAPADEGIPPYLDLGRYAGRDGTPFSGSSVLLAALAAALGNHLGPGFRARLAALSAWTGDRIAALGLPLLLGPASRSPAVFTLPLPPGRSSEAIGRSLEARGMLVSYNSEYLLRRNWIQICLMADQEQDKVDRLLRELARCLEPR
jgi:aspartate aminotransferase-like enzyme